MSKKTRLPFELGKDERGTILIPFALMSVIAIAAVGGAVDFGRAYQQRARMQNAIDAAVLSGMSVYQSTQSWTSATNEAQSNFTGYYSNVVLQNANGTATAGVDVPLVSFTNNGTAMTATASMQSTTPFLQGILGQHLQLSATSSASLSGTTTTNTTHKKAEVAMMIDLTGSMGSTVNGTTKIAALKTAGLSLLDTLLPNSGSNDPYVKVGIAPFADYVNAGSYAAAVTGQAATGAYANLTNLSTTRQGVFNGSYSGYYSTASSQPSGSQAGATAPSGNTGSGSGSPGSFTTSGLPYGSTSNWTYSGGGTYANQYCATPTQTTTVTSTKTASISSSNVTAAIGSPSQSFTSYNSGGVTYTVTWGQYFFQSSGSWYYIGNSGSDNNGSYGPMYKQSSNGSWSRYNSSYYYYNNYTATTTTTTTTVAGCENSTQSAAAATPPTGPLISCVTERTTSAGVLDYTASAITSASDIGAYNRGVSTISNYSSDGKCHVAGRELAPVIPLTNAKTTLQNFFNGPANNGPLIGGGTPGHLGTAWASYLLSPNWSSIWGSAPADYTDTGVKKYAILMTDGEYNEQYYTNDGTSTAATSATQALALCTEMKSKGITVITIGFGYSVNAVSPATPSATGSTEQRAMYTLQQCASPAANGVNYYFPYDSTQLSTVFTNIGNSVAAQVTQTVVQRGGRITQ